MYEQNHLAYHLRAASAGCNDATCLTIHPSMRKLSYGAFFENAERLAAALVHAGVTPGDRVAIQADKTVAMLELYIATILAGAVFLPLNPAYTASEVSYFLSDANPALFVCDPAKLPDLEAIAQKHGARNVWTLAGDETGTLIAAREQEQPGFVPVQRSADDLAAILYTSGTTGRSKGAMLTHRALASNSLTLKSYWHFTEKDVLIHALPIFHTHGLFVATNITLMCAGQAIFLDRFDADAVLQHMPNATALMGVPTFYTRLLKSNQLADASKNMRLFISGSAPLLAETHEKWRQQTGHAILERYGMTETNMNTSNPYSGERMAGTVGFALPDVEIIITDPETGEPVPDGQAGILEVRGPNVFAGYWKMPEKTAEELRENGFFITGDIASVDQDGYISIIGRAKDLIISGGFNIYPKEIEVLIDDLKGVSESAVIGVPHPDFGEAVCAVVVLEPNSTVTSELILEAIAPNLARFKQPKSIQIVDELPRNAMGKVQKKGLRQEFSKLFKRN